MLVYYGKCLKVDDGMIAARVSGVWAMCVCVSVFVVRLHINTPVTRVAEAFHKTQHKPLLPHGYSESVLLFRH